MKQFNLIALTIAVPVAIVARPGAVSAHSGDDTPHDHAAHAHAHVHYIDGPRADAPIPRPGVDLVPGAFALVVIDPQNDFLSPDGVAWGVVGESVTENGTVDNLARLFAAAKRVDAPVFVSPHYYYEHDHQWKFEGALETLMHDIGMFDRKGPLNVDGLEGSGADWLDQYKPYINDGKTVVVSPHKVYGPESNDLTLQLRKAGVNQIILAGMSANLCVESHMRDLVEEGFEVAVVSDATAAAKLPGYDGFEAAFVNYRMIASDVWSTAEATAKINDARRRLVNLSGSSGVALSGSDAVELYRGASPVNGSPFITAEHAGAVYFFISEANRDTFAANPTQFAPQYGGYCSYGVSLGKLLPADLSTAQVRDGRLYLNVNPEIRELFDADYEGNVARANAHWPDLFALHAK